MQLIKLIFLNNNLYYFIIINKNSHEPKKSNILMLEDIHTYPQLDKY